MNVGKKITVLFISLLGWLGIVGNASGCIWDSDTMLQERWARPKMATAILGDPPKPPAPGPLQKRIADLKAAPRETDAAWWNDLAGAHLRLGEAMEAAKLLEGVTNRFANDYGVHANLGTAYHLLGRYADAEREIARDLEINPGAHFGLEKFHLALLQYLARDKEYQQRHVYVDEFTDTFLEGHFLHMRPVEGLLTNQISTGLSAEARKELGETLAELKNEDDAAATKYRSYALRQLASNDPTPAYRLHWNLGSDTNLEAGVIYLASLNPKEPACFVMLGVKSLANRDLNLAAAAFDRAIALGSPQADLLREQAKNIREHIAKGQTMGMPARQLFYALIAVLVIGYALFVLWRRRKRRLCSGKPLAEPRKLS